MRKVLCPQRLHTQLSKVSNVPKPLNLGHQKTPGQPSTWPGTSISHGCEKDGLEPSPKVRHVAEHMHKKSWPCTWWPIWQPKKLPAKVQIQFPREKSRQISTLPNKSCLRTLVENINSNLKPNKHALHLAPKYTHHFLINQSNQHSINSLHGH